MFEQIAALVASYRDESKGFAILVTDGEILSEIENRLDEAGLNYCDCSEYFDGGPGYEATHYVVSFVDENGILQMIDWIEESY